MDREALIPEQESSGAEASAPRTPRRSESVLSRVSSTVSKSGSAVGNTLVVRPVEFIGSTAKKGGSFVYSGASQIFVTRKPKTSSDANSDIEDNATSKVSDPDAAASSDDEQEEDVVDAKERPDKAPLLKGPSRSKTLHLFKKSRATSKTESLPEQRKPIIPTDRTTLYDTKQNDKTTESSSPSPAIETWDDDENFPLSPSLMERSSNKPNWKVFKLAPQALKTAWSSTLAAIDESREIGGSILKGRQSKSGHPPLGPNAWDLPANENSSAEGVSRESSWIWPGVRRFGPHIPSDSDEATPLPLSMLESSEMSTSATDFEKAAADEARGKSSDSEGGTRTPAMPDQLFHSRWWNADDSKFVGRMSHTEMSLLKCGKRFIPLKQIQDMLLGLGTSVRRGRCTWKAQPELVIMLSDARVSKLEELAERDFRAKARNHPVRTLNLAILGVALVLYSVCLGYLAIARYPTSEVAIQSHVVSSYPPYIPPGPLPPCPPGQYPYPWGPYACDPRTESERRKEGVAPQWSPHIPAPAAPVQQPPASYGTKKPPIGMIYFYTAATGLLCFIFIAGFGSPRFLMLTICRKAMISIATEIESDLRETVWKKMEADAFVYIHVIRHLFFLSGDLTSAQYRIMKFHLWRKFDRMLEENITSNPMHPSSSETGNRPLAQLNDWINQNTSHIRKRAAFYLVGIPLLLYLSCIIGLFSWALCLEFVLSCSGCWKEHVSLCIATIVIHTIFFVILAVGTHAVTLRMVARPLVDKMTRHAVFYSNCLLSVIWLDCVTEPLSQYVLGPKVQIGAKQFLKAGAALASESHTRRQDLKSTPTCAASEDPRKPKIIAGQGTRRNAASTPPPPSGPGKVLGSIQRGGKTWLYKQRTDVISGVATFYWEESSGPTLPNAPEAPSIGKPEDHARLVHVNCTNCGCGLGPSELSRIRIERMADNEFPDSGGAPASGQHTDADESQQERKLYEAPVPPKIEAFGISMFQWCVAASANCMPEGRTCDGMILDDESHAKKGTDNNRPSKVKSLCPCCSGPIVISFEGFWR